MYVPFQYWVPPGKVNDEHFVAKTNNDNRRRVRIDHRKFPNQTIHEGIAGPKMKQFVHLNIERTVSAQISHDHIATAFHFLISNLGGAGPFAGALAYCCCRMQYLGR